MQVELPNPVLEVHSGELALFSVNCIRGGHDGDDKN